jgi:uncharacterized phage-associated protein
MILRLENGGNREMYEPLVGFRSRKGAQVAAFFAAKECPIEKLKLIKLIYLSEREFVSEYGEPMLYDELFSLQHGPICFSCLNAIDGKTEEQIWGKYIKRDGSKNILAKKTFEREELDELSDAEFDILNSIWESFGFMTASQIRNYTHKNCPEYTEIERGRVPISYRDILKALGDEDADDIEDRIGVVRRSEAILSALQ